MNTTKEINETQIIEQKDLREQYINRVEVLEKVKKLFLMPEMEMMTTRQIADYYEVCKQRLERLLAVLKTKVSENKISKLRIIKILAASSEVLGNERGIIRNAAELRGIDPERINIADTIQGILRMTDLQINDIPVVECVVEISRLLETFLNKLSAVCEI